VREATAMRVFEVGADRAIKSKQKWIEPGESRRSKVEATRAQREQELLRAMIGKERERDPVRKFGCGEGLLGAYCLDA
jgi:hypothetical protein